MASATSSLGRVLGLGDLAYDELYQAVDWLLARWAEGPSV
jgi:hypothetical protein